MPRTSLSVGLGLALATVVLLPIIVYDSNRSFARAAYSSLRAANCTPADTCFSEVCSCLSVASPTSNDGTTRLATLCLQSSSKSCTERIDCLYNLTDCLNTVALDNTQTASCLAWSDGFRLAQLAVGAGTAWNATELFRTCTTEISYWDGNNATNTSSTSTSTTQCNFKPNRICASPVQYIGILRIAGDHWATILQDAVAKNEVRSAVEVDLTRKLANPVAVLALSAGSLIVRFAVPKTLDSQLSDALTSAASDSSWLQQTKIAYANNGGTDNVTVLAISTEGGTSVPVAGSDSSSPPGSESSASGSSPADTYAPQEVVAASEPILGTATAIGIIVAIAGALLIGIVICGFLAKRSADRGREY